MPLNPPLPAWREATVWIIGASTGIGAATARALLAAGARVALSARKADALAEVAGASERALVLPLDYTDSAAVRAAWTTLQRDWGRVDLVLVVAGTHQEMRAWELDEAAAMALLKTNLHGVIGTCAVVVPGLLAQGAGALGIVASVAGYRGLPKALIYGASKAAVINFTESLYLDLEPKGIGVYLISPGFVKTPLTDSNDFKMPALISAEEAAGMILKGLRQGRFEIHFPKRFTLLLKFLQMLPYRWYFALIHKSTGL
ncbi:MAG: SDR family NAD(P)-dependent oxidoreductase [Betaproteobacteria bacterium]|nr:SDR family NAD(P)-dependent oxidoreductase [Betaproteobacteria bacterium]